MVNIEHVPQGHLSNADIDMVEDLKKGGVLQKVSGDVAAELVEQVQKGIVFCSCSDGKRFRDALGFLDNVLMKFADEIHPLTLAGGSQAGYLSNPEFMHTQVGIGYSKGYRTLVLLGHAPCLACHLEQKSVFEAVRTLFEMKDFLKSKFEDLKILIFFHVDYRGTGLHKKMKTYHLCRRQWLRYTDNTH